MAKTKRKSLKASRAISRGAKGSSEFEASNRPVMFRPERAKYVRKTDRPKGCVFCAAAKAGVGAERLVLYKDARVMVIMNKYPYNSGHLLILPVRHEGDFLKLKDKELADLQMLLRRCIQAVSDEYDPAGFNVGLNLGAAAGAGIPEHLHYHLVPRWRGDTNFFPVLANTKVVVETLEQTFARLLPYFKDSSAD
jgi:ATP adenylyltransferase